eukprot:11254324-Alexandrium_andersonii.AAC.1
MARDCNRLWGGPPFMIGHSSSRGPIQCSWLAAAAATERVHSNERHTTPRCDCHGNVPSARAGGQAGVLA